MSDDIALSDKEQDLKSRIGDGLRYRIRHQATDEGSIYTTYGYIVGFIDPTVDGDSYVIVGSGPGLLIRPEDIVTYEPGH